MQSLAKRRVSPALFLVHSAPAWRPLFVPPGITKVRNGPTTPAELARLAATEPASTDRDTQEPAGPFGRLLALLGLSSPAHAR